MPVDNAIAVMRDFAAHLRKRCNPRGIQAAFLIMCAVVSISARVTQAQTATVLAVPGKPTLYAVTIGNGDRTVIVVHGGPGVSHAYLRPEWDVIGETARVVYYDQRGCGSSARWTPYSWQAHIDDLDRVVNAATRGRVILAGTSWGSLLSVIYAHRHPERVEALLLSGVPRWPAGVAEWRAHLPDSIQHRLSRIESGLEVDPLPPPDSAHLLLQTPGIQPALAGRLARSRVCDDVSLATSASYASLPPLDSIDIQIPLLIIRGAPSRSDRAASLKDGWLMLSSHFPGATVVNVDESGHDPWFENPRATFSAIQKFLDGLVRPRVDRK